MYLYKTSIQNFYNLYELIDTLSPTTYILYFNYPCFKISLSQHTFRNEYEFVDTSFSRFERHILIEPRKKIFIDKHALRYLPREH